MCLWFPSMRVIQTLFDWLFYAALPSLENFDVLCVLSRLCMNWELWPETRRAKVQFVWNEPWREWGIKSEEVQFFYFAAYVNVTPKYSMVSGKQWIVDFHSYKQFFRVIWIIKCADFLRSFQISLRMTCDCDFDVSRLFHILIQRLFAFVLAT